MFLFCSSIKNSRMIFQEGPLPKNKRDGDSRMLVVFSTYYMEWPDQ